MDKKQFLKDAEILKRKEFMLRSSMNFLVEKYIKECSPVKLDTDGDGNPIPKRCRIETYYTVTDYGRHERRLVKDEYVGYLCGYEPKSMECLETMMGEIAMRAIGSKDGHGMDRKRMERCAELYPIFHSESNGKDTGLEISLRDHYVRYWVDGEEDKVYEYNAENDPRVKYNLNVTEERE